MQIRTAIASTLTTIAIAGGIAIAGTPAHAATTTTTCRTTVTHHHSVTSKGTVSDYTLRKYQCGKNYTEAEAGTTSYASGAYSWYAWQKDMTYPCWTKGEVRHSVSAKGTETVTVTHTGNC